MSAHTPFIPQALEACGHCVRTADGRGWLMAEVPATTEHASSYAQLFAAAPELLAACHAAQRYNAAIYRRGADGQYDLDPKGAIADGADLDALYFDWIAKANAAVAKATGAAP